MTTLATRWLRPKLQTTSEANPVGSPTLGRARVASVGYPATGAKVCPLATVNCSTNCCYRTRRPPAKRSNTIISM
jgi:hypothetical protein